MLKHSKTYNNLSTWVVAVLLLLMFNTTFAQQDGQYTQYMYNTVTVNPAYAGSRGNLSVAALYRAQWLGLDGAPESQTFNFHSPVGFKGIGLGISVLNETIGPTQETYFDIDFSYTIKTGPDQNLSFGLKASAHLLDILYSQLTFDQNTPAILPGDIDNKFTPNIGAGVYYHTERFYAGLSVPRILETEHFQEGPNPTTASERMHYYFITGHVWDLSPSIKFKPTLLTKVVSGAPIQVDVSTNFMFNEKFIGGVGYRWDAAISAMFGFQWTDKMLIGLAYDRETSELGGQNFNNGSFEVILRYDFVKKVTKIRSPRFF